VKELLGDTAARARYLTELDRRSVVPSPEAVARLQTLGGPLPENPSDPTEHVTPYEGARFIWNICE
jgi:hypothetical protein